MLEIEWIKSYINNCSQFTDIHISNMANCVICKSEGSKAFTCSFPGCNCNGNTNKCARVKHILCDNNECLDKVKEKLKNAKPTVYAAVLDGGGPITMIVNNKCNHPCKDCIYLENIRL